MNEENLEAEKADHLTPHGLHVRLRTSLKSYWLFHLY